MLFWGLFWLESVAQIHAINCKNRISFKNEEFSKQFFCWINTDPNNNLSSETQQAIFKVYFTFKNFVLSQKSINLAKNFNNCILRSKETKNKFFNISRAFYFKISLIYAKIQFSITIKVKNCISKSDTLILR